MSLTPDEWSSLLAAVGEVVSGQMSELRGEMQSELRHWVDTTNHILGQMQTAMETLNESDHRLAGEIRRLGEGQTVNGMDARELLTVLAKGMGLSVSRAKTIQHDEPEPMYGPPVDMDGLGD